MVSISKFGDSSIKFTFTQNDHYLYGQGEITVPLNSLNLIIDESDMVTFKKIDGDTFISFLIGNSNFSSKNDLEDWYKENMVGGGSSVSSGDVQTMIDESISGKVDTSAVTTSVTSASTDSEIPTAKAVWEAASGGGGGKAISAGTNISVTTGETADTVSCTLPISADTNGIYTTSSYPFGGIAHKSLNVVFGINNTINKNGSSSFMSYNFMTGRGNKIADGEYNATNMYSHFISGQNNKIEPSASEASAVFGTSNIAKHSYEFCSGLYNVSNTGSTYADNTLFSVGNGTSNSARHNAFEIRQNGDIYITSGGTDIKLQDTLGGGIDSGTVQTMIDASTSGYTARFAEDEEVTAAGLNALNEALSGKQDTLSAGTNITIVDNVISAEGGGGKAISAGTNISVTTGETADTINCTLPITISDSVNGSKQSIAIGDGSSAHISNSFDSIAIGKNSKGYFGSVVIGSNPTAYSTGNGNNVAIGNNTKFYNNSVVIGNYAEGYNEYGANSIAIGLNAKAKNMKNAVAIGAQVSTTGTTKTNINNQLTIDTSNQVYIYNKENTEMICLQDALGGGIDSGTVQTMIDASTSGYTARFAEDEEVTAAGLNALNEALSGKQDTLSAGRGISIDSADTISLDLAISGGSGTNSIAENIGTTASGSYSHAEGFYTIADGSSSHAEGGYTSASTDYAHAEGYSTYASMQAHAEGQYTSAMTNSSHAEGSFTYTSNNSEHASGQYNVSSSGSSTFGDSGNTLFSVGNGTADNARHNAFEIRQNGDIYCNNGTSDVKLQDYLQIKVVKLTQIAYDALSPYYDANTLYVIVN